MISAFEDAEEVEAKSEEEGEDGLVLPRRVTVRDVLKYSLS